MRHMQSSAASSTTPSDTKASTNKAIDVSLVSRFLGYLKRYPKPNIIGMAAMPVTISCSLLVPWLIMHIVDTHLPSKDVGALTFWSAALIAVVVFNYISDALFSYSLQKAAIYALSDMRSDMFSRVLRFPRSYYDKRPIGVTLTRLTSDIEAINESFTQGLLGMVRDVLTTLALLIFLFLINWQLTLVTLLASPVLYFLTEYLRKRLRDSYSKARTVLSQGTGYLQEVLNGIKTIQLYSAESEVQNNYTKFTQGFFKAQSRSNRFDAILFSCVEGITTIVTAVIFWYGAGKILDSALTVGVVIAFVHTLDKIFDPIRDFTMQIASIQRAFAAFEHVEEIYQQPLEDDNLAELSAEETLRLKRFVSVEFNDVHFRYGDDNPWVLKGVSFTLEKGHQIALVGGTGSGKSTILKLLSRTYDGYEGSIKLNGIELRRIPKKTIRTFFAIMQQEVFLFNESIAFNIGLGNQNLDEAKIRDAARFVYADRFIDVLPEKYQFKIKDNGANLSSGQAQLVAFARAIAGGSEVIMLDEATAAVDSVTERWIQKAIDHVFEDKTVIAIAHRLSTIQHSDQILVLENGSILERGTHRSLLELDGKYAALYSAMEATEDKDN